MNNDRDEEKHDKNKEIELRVRENKHGNHQQYEDHVKLNRNARAEPILNEHFMK